MNFLDAAHILTLNCDEMVRDRPRQPAYEIFSIKRRYHIPSPGSLGSRRSAQAGVKHSYSPPPKKVVILPQLSRVAWKRLQISTDMLHLITSTGDGFFRFVNIDDLKWSWTPKKVVLVNFFSQFLTATHISTVNCDEMIGDSPRQCEIFSIKRRF